MVRLELVLPALAGSVGAMLLRKVFGDLSVEDVLGTFADGPAFDRKTDAGIKERVYPAALPPGEAIWLTLPVVGRFALENDKGLLRLETPVRAQDWIATHLGPRIVSGPQDALDATHTQRVIHTWLHTKPGIVLNLPVGGIFGVRLDIPVRP